MLRRVCGKSPHVSAMLLKHVIFPSIERDGLVMHVNSDLWARELLGVACEKPGSDFGGLRVARKRFVGPRATRSGLRVARKRFVGLRAARKPASL